MHGGRRFEQGKDHGRTRQGVVLKARLDYLTMFHGEDACKRLRESLEPETRGEPRQGVLISSWYPVAVSVEMMEAMDRMFGKGDLAPCREMGRYSARVALSGVDEEYALEKGFAFVNRMTPRMWQHCYDSDTRRRKAWARAGP